MNRTILFSLILSLGVLLAACDSDDETPESTSYTLNEVDGSGVTGTATFTKISDTETEVTLDITGDAVTGDHPAHIHSGAAGSGGPIVVPLTTVDAAATEGESIETTQGGDLAEGNSVTTVTQYDSDEDGTAETDIDYEGLLEYNGYINVHESPDNLANVISTTNIGANAE